MNAESADPDAVGLGTDPQGPCAGRLTLVVAAGELDVATVDELARVLGEAVDDDSPDRALVLDLHRVGFIDCASLGILVRTRNRLGDRFWLAAPSRPVRRLLDLTGLTTHFLVTDSPCDVHTAEAVRKVPAVRLLS